MTDPRNYVNLAIVFIKILFLPIQISDIVNKRPYFQIKASGIVNKISYYSKLVRYLNY